MEKICIRSPLIVTFILLQSCSNTLIGEKLENSFDITKEIKTLEKTNNKPNKLYKEIKSKSRIKDDKKEKDVVSIIKENSISSKDRLSPKSMKTIFNPRPYRIILRLSGANPSAPAETVTEALRKAGVQFEVEKIERFDEENFSKNTSLNR